MLSNRPNKYDEIVRVSALPPAREGGGGLYPPLSNGVGAVLGRQEEGGVLGRSAHHSAAARGWESIQYKN